MSVEQPKNPLHGVTLAEIVTRLQAFYGWEELGRQINVRCFTHDPSISSSLKFLRRTPWAREKVESFYLFHLRELKRRGLTGEGAPLSSTAVPEEAVSPEIVEVAPVEMATPEEMALPGEVAPRIGQWEPW